MTERVLGVRVSIFRFVSNEPQPGIVQCELVDAHGERWTFTEKTAIVSGEYLDDQSTYPRPGVILCQVVGRHLGPSGEQVVEVVLECSPDTTDSPRERTRFEVLAGEIVEWEWGSDTEHPWSGFA